MIDMPAVYTFVIKYWDNNGDEAAYRTSATDEDHARDLFRLMHPTETIIVVECLLGR